MIPYALHGPYGDGHEEDLHELFSLGSLREASSIEGILKEASFIKNILEVASFIKDSLKVVSVNLDIPKETSFSWDKNILEGVPFNFMDILKDVVVVVLKEAFASKEFITEDISHGKLINNFDLAIEEA